jgi:hypothetical protein
MATSALMRTRRTPLPRRRLLLLLMMMLLLRPAAGKPPTTLRPPPGETASLRPRKPASAHGGTPVMAWSSWYAFGGGLNETKILRAAELMVERGLVAAGYGPDPAAGA